MTETKDNYKYRKGVSEDHLRYLEETYKYHSDRNQVIENKLTQISGQSGIILALVSLYIPIFYSRLDSFSSTYKGIILIVFLVGFVFLLFSIIKARSFLNIGKYRFVVKSQTTVFKDHPKKQDFVIEQVKDLVYAIEKNVEIVNGKGTELIIANRWFTRGLIVIASLSIILIVGSLFDNPSETVTEIDVEYRGDLDQLQGDMRGLLLKLDSIRLQETVEDSVKSNL